MTEPKSPETEDNMAKGQSPWGTRVCGEDTDVSCNETRCDLSLVLTVSPSRSVNAMAPFLPSSGLGPFQEDLSVLVLPTLPQRLAWCQALVAAHSQCRWPRRLPPLTSPTSTPWSAAASHRATFSLLGDVKRIPTKFCEKPSSCYF